MEIINQSHEILTPVDRTKVLKFIEQAGRVAYQSEPKITENSAPNFVSKLIKSGHESVIEHFNVSVKFITDRGVLAEITRHRLCSFTVESTRFCNYSKQDITFIRPAFWYDMVEEKKYLEWVGCMSLCESSYNILIRLGATPQEARTVLPNSLKTTIVVTTNLREWRHILKLRTAKDAHPQMRALMIPLLHEFYALLPEVFNDIMEGA